MLSNHCDSQQDVVPMGLGVNQTKSEDLGFNSPALHHTYTKSVSQGQRVWFRK